MTAIPSAERVLQAAEFGDYAEETTAVKINSHPKPGLSRGKELWMTDHFWSEEHL